MPKPLTIKQIAETDLSGVKKTEIDAILDNMVKKFNARARSFRSAKNKNVYSPALENFFEIYPHGIADISELNFHQKQALMFRIQDFFQAKTSSVSGAREVAREQDARIFGTRADGKPLYRMTREQRVAFWDSYEEFMHQNPNWSQKSFQVQEALGVIAQEAMDKSGTFHGIFGKIALLKKTRDLALQKERESDVQSYEVFRTTGVREPR